MLKIKRVYFPAEPDDGLRVLIDRLWPRGLTKDVAAVDLWLKEIAPSAELRKWFGHYTARWPRFRARYLEELKGQEQSAAFERLRLAVREYEKVTLLFGAREEMLSHAAILRDCLTSAPTGRFERFSLGRVSGSS